MNMSAGGAADLGPEEPETAAEERQRHLRDELETARRKAVMTNARFALALRETDDPAQLATVADEAMLAAGQVVGFARLLSRAILPVVALYLS